MGPLVSPVVVAAEDRELSTTFPAPNSRYEPVSRTEFDLVDEPEMTLHFDQPGEAGYQRVTIEGPMRRRWQTAIAIRVTVPS